MGESESRKTSRNATQMRVAQGWNTVPDTPNAGGVRSLREAAIWQR